MKNVVDCYKEFFGYFNALETNGDSTNPAKKIITETMYVSFGFMCQKIVYYQVWLYSVYYIS